MGGVGGVGWRNRGVGVGEGVRGVLIGALGFGFGFGLELELWLVVGL